MRGKTEVRITIIYLVIGILWITLSDEAILMLGQSAEDITRLQNYKGWFFVISTSLLIFFLIRQEIRKRNAVEDLLRLRNEELSESLETIRQYQTEKRSSQKRFLGLYENIREGFAWLDISGNIKGANPAFLNMLNFASEQLLGKHYRELCPIGFTRFLSEIEERGYTDIIDIELLNSTGQKVPVSLMAYKMPAPTGDSEEIWVIVKDIVDQKKAEKDILKAMHRAKQSERLKSAFLANISHEIRTPMNSIIGFAELLGNDDLPDERRKWYSRIIAENAEMLLAIVNNVLDISRLETGQLKVVRHETDLNKIISDIYDLFTLQAQEKGIELNIKNLLPKELAIVHTDESKLKQILINLTGNAIKFTHEGQINISCSVENGEVYFSIADTGIGIAPEDQKAIFERFRQVDDSTTRKYGGTGLGLTISLGLTELLGGSLKLESEHGKGSVFHVRIPVQTPVPGNETTLKKDSVLSRKPEGASILVVEDGRASSLLIKEALRELDANIILVKDGESAIEVCSENTAIRLVLMDLNLPGIDGTETARLIKEKCPGILIIGQSAQQPSHQNSSKQQTIFDDFLLKPYLPKELVALVKKHI
ncbi:ATP-binding response regulator [Prolixibacter bellariivorans]|uniref:ATP-binding response regulator n=1 Tax=Prolixibacter bellariivorans TaxID=314319 RepID=UPI00056D1960|nr:PAS domain-containing hybrid sensor histidine kinase/response regulator [Prolixibacter bellariivorans]